jgi:hypothetical protein
MPKFSLLIALTLSDFVTENQNIYTQEIICMNSLFIVHLLPHLKRAHDVISKFFKTNWYHVGIILLELESIGRS